VIFLNIVNPRINAPKNKNIKIPNSTHAILAAVDSTLVNPNNPAIIAIAKKINDHFNIVVRV